MSDERELSTRELIFWWCAALLGSAALLVLVGLLLVGCANVGALQGGTIDFSKPQQPLPQVLVPVHDAAGNLPTHLVGTLTPWDGSPAIPGINTAQGVVFLTRSTGGATLTFSADGCATYEQPITIEATAPGIVLKPAFVPLPRLIARGEFFGLSAPDPRFTVIGASSFRLYEKFLDDPATFEAVATELETHGFNLVRVWTLYDVTFSRVPGYGCDAEACDYAHLVPAERPNFYTQLPAFVEALANHHLYVELTAFTGTSRLLPALADQQAHLNQLVALARYETNVIVEVGNEYEQGDNWWHADQLRYPDDILIAAGSAGAGAWPSALGLPVLRYEEYHTNGLPEWWRKESHEAQEMAGDNHSRVLTNESTRPDQDPTLAHFFDAGAGCTLLPVGCVFHFVSGRMSDRMDVKELAFADAWVAGARSVPLACQDAGGYQHRMNLEGPDDLRVYQRGDDPACIVRIRK